MAAVLDDLIIKEDMSIEEAMRTIDEGTCKTVFLVKNGKLEGVLTDGDIRRYLLNGGDIKDNVCRIVNYSPKFFFECEEIDYQAYMIDNVITALPIVDAEKKLIKVELLRSSEEIRRKIEADVPIVMMAGGMGSRLKPYTEIIPKPLIPIGTKTITEHIFDKFGLYGCTNLKMIVNYKKSLIKAYFDDIHKYENLSFVEEPFFMGTAGGVTLLKDCLKTDFFLVNCDILVDYDYYEIWEKHMVEQNIVTMVSAKKKISVPYGTVYADDKGKVCELVEKPTLVYDINIGMYLCNPKIFEYINEEEKIDMPDLIQRCIDSNEKIGLVTIGEQNWYDMGQLQELELMKKRMDFV